MAIRNQNLVRWLGASALFVSLFVSCDLKNARRPIDAVGFLGVTRGLWYNYQRSTSACPGQGCKAVCVFEDETIKVLRDPSMPVEGAEDASLHIAAAGALVVELTSLTSTSILKPFWRVRDEDADVDCAALTYIPALSNISFDVPLLVVAQFDTLLRLTRQSGAGGGQGETGTAAVYASGAVESLESVPIEHVGNDYLSSDPNVYALRLNATIGGTVQEYRGQLDSSPTLYLP